MKDHPNLSLEMFLIRCRKTNSIHIAAENRKKLEKLVQIMIQHVIYLGNNNNNNNSNNAFNFDVITKFLYELARDDVGSWFMGNSFVVILEKLNKRLDDYQQQQQHSTNKPPPSLSPGEIAFFHVAGTIFVSSDFRHPVLSPAMLVLSRYLSYSTKYNNKVEDILCTIEICRVLFFLAKNSKKLVPEAILCVKTLLGKIIKQEIEIEQETMLNTIIQHCFTMLLNVMINKSDDPSLDVLLGDVSELCTEAMKLITLDETISFLTTTKQHCMEIISNMLQYREALRSSNEEDFSNKAGIIKSLTPRFIITGNKEITSATTSNNHDRNNKQRILQRTLKRERKATAREIRLDAKFASEFDTKQRQEKITSLRQERFKNHSQLQIQQAQFNKSERKKMSSRR
jgi:nucleolar protein 14